MELPVYKYRPLNRSQIRLLEVLPDATTRMKHVDLKKSSKPFKYAALSYTWGASTETFPFQCEAYNLPVRQNLLNALSQLKNLVTTPLWVDAMCINQSDEIEKMGQIQLMTDIYRKAESVLIWLGEEIPETRNAVAQIRNVTATLKNLQVPPVNMDSILSPLFVTGIRHLLTCAWWPRLWVLQEATLARDATFICGSQLVPWKLLSALVKQIRRLDLCGLFRGHDRRPEFCDGFTELHNVELVRHTHSTTLAPDLLRICRQRICFDPCDRVYAVIGLMDKYVQEGFIWEPGEKVEDLYPPFVAILLQMDPTAILLSLNETTQRNPKLPSWCPDLHYRSVSDVLADHEGYHAGFTVQTTTTFDFDHKDPGKIRTKGIVMDTVKAISIGEWIVDEIDNPLHENTQYSAEQRNIMLLQSYIAVAVKILEEKDMWRVFVGNMIGQQDSKLHWLAGFSSIHDRLANRRWKEQAKKFQNAFQELQACNPSAGEPSSAIHFYLKSARRVCYGRKFFTTKAGHVGLGPRSMAVGDLVCILKCAKVPFVLKKHSTLSDTYYLRGEAYVQGLMYGEYLKVNKRFHWITLV